MMLAHPKIGQRVRIWYGQPMRSFCPHHGKVGRIPRTARGPRMLNHEVALGTSRVVVPCGNLRTER